MQNDEMTLAEQTKASREKYYQWNEVTLEGQRYRVGLRDGEPRVVEIWRGELPGDTNAWDRVTNDEAQVYVARVIRFKPSQS